MERDAIDFGSLKVSVLFRRLFIPTLCGMLSISAVTVADGIFVGQGVGSDGIAAVNIYVPLLMVFQGMGFMIGIGCSVVASIHLSQSKIRAARLNVTQAMVFVTAVTLLLSSAILLFPDRTAVLLGASEHLLPLGKDYLLWFTPALVFQMWTAVGLFVIRLDGAPKLAMWCSVISALLNVLLDWLFIFPLGRGVMGAAFATAISVSVGGGIALWYLLCRARSLSLCPLKGSRKSLRLSLRNVGYQCRIGSSALLGEATLATLMFTGNQVFMRYLGDDGVGAFGIACYYIPFVFMVGNAIAQSAQPIISYNYGAGNKERVKATMKRMILVCLTGTLLLAGVAIFAPQIYTGLFTDNKGLLELTCKVMPVYFLGISIFGIQCACQTSFISLGQAKVSLFIALLRKIILLIPLAVILPKFMGVMGIYRAEPIADVISVLTTSAVFIITVKKVLRNM